MSLLRFSGVGKQFGERWILRDVDFQVAQGDRWGIVGRNGVGKTTLFRLLTGEEHPADGEIWRHPGTRFTLLQQNRGEQGSTTVGEAAREPFADLLAMEQRLEFLADALDGIVPWGSTTACWKSLRVVAGTRSARVQRLRWKAWRFLRKRGASRFGS